MKKAVITVALMVLAFSVNAANNIQWYNPGEMYDWSGNLMPEDSGCVIRLYTTTDDTISFSIVGGVAIASGDDAWSGMEFNLLSGGDIGLGYADMTPSTISAGTKIYSVIFSQSPTAGYFAIADDAVQTVNYNPDTFLYITDKDVQQGDWQAIPEPATAMLLAIGGGIAWLVRLKQRFS